MCAQMNCNKGVTLLQLVCLSLWHDWNAIGHLSAFLLGHPLSLSEEDLRALTCAECEHVLVYLWMRNKESWQTFPSPYFLKISTKSNKNVSQPSSCVTNQPLKCVRQWTADIRVWRHTLPCHSMLFISTVSVFEFVLFCPFPLSVVCPMTCRSSGRRQ